MPQSPVFFFAVLIKWVLCSTTCGFSSFDNVCEHEISQNTAARHCKLDGDHISQDCNFRCHFAFLRGILAENHRFGKNQSILVSLECACQEQEVCAKIGKNCDRRSISEIFAQVSVGWSHS